MSYQDYLEQFAPQDKTVECVECGDEFEPDPDVCQINCDDCEQVITDAEEEARDAAIYYRRRMS